MVINTGTNAEVLKQRLISLIINQCPKR